MRDLLKYLHHSADGSCKYVSYIITVNALQQLSYPGSLCVHYKFEYIYLKCLSTHKINVRTQNIDVDVTISIDKKVPQIIGIYL